MNLKKWIKKHWWKIIIPFIIIPVLIFMYWLKKHYEIKEIVGYASEK